LESGGCTQYFEENTGVEIRPSTEFLNETEYREWKESQNEERRLQAPVLNSTN